MVMGYDLSVAFLWHDVITKVSFAGRLPRFGGVTLG